MNMLHCNLTPTQDNISAIPKLYTDNDTIIWCKIHDKIRKNEKNLKIFTNSLDFNR